MTPELPRDHAVAVAATDPDEDLFALDERQPMRRVPHPPARQRIRVRIRAADVRGTPNSIATSATRAPAGKRPRSPPAPPASTTETDRASQPSSLRSPNTKSIVLRRPDESTLA